MCMCSLESFLVDFSFLQILASRLDHSKKIVCRNIDCGSCVMIGSPVMLRKFDSGVKVIQNKSHSDEEVLSSLILLRLPLCISRSFSLCFFTSSFSHPPDEILFWPCRL